MITMKSLQTLLWEELTKKNPFNWDAGAYYDLAHRLLKDNNHPSWRFIGEELRKKCNYDN